MKEYQLEIVAGGCIQLRIDTIYSATARDTWRCVLAPGEWERAEELLDAYHMAIVTAVWTKEVVEQWHLTELAKTSSIAQA